MRAIIAYDSAFGNTAQVARALADEIVGAGHTAELVSLRAHRAPTLDGDLLFVGGPTRFGRMTRRVASLLRRLDAARWGSRPIVLFDTFGPTGDLEEARWKETKALYPGAAGGMETLATGRGLRVHPQVLRCRVLGLRGPLAPEALDTARAFARSVVEVYSHAVPSEHAELAEPLPTA